MTYRYTFPLAAADLEQLAAELAAAGAPPLALGGSENGTAWADYPAPLTAPQFAAVSAAFAGHVPDPTNPAKRLRAAAKFVIQATEPTPQSLRAVMLVLARRLIAQDNAVANASSLNDLKARWASVVANNPVSKQAVADFIDGGGAD